jgi:hypothetical protein
MGIISLGSFWGVQSERHKNNKHVFGVFGIDVDHDCAVGGMILIVIIGRFL